MVTYGQLYIYDQFLSKQLLNAQNEKHPDSNSMFDFYEWRYSYGRVIERN